MPRNLFRSVFLLYFDYLLVREALQRGQIFQSGLEALPGLIFQQVGV